jgi:hypothetical protein
MAKFAGVAVLTAGIVLGLPGSSRAGLTTILDQIGPNPTYVQGNTAYNSQIFGSPYTKDNLGVVDNFSITTAGTTLTEVDAAILGSAGFVAGDYAEVTAFRVEVYSSVAAAASSLTGDVYEESAKPTDFTLTAPYGTDPFSALARISIDLTLGVGTYELALIPVLNYTSSDGAKIGVYSSTYGGDSNAYQVNPGGGFGFAGNTNALDTNAAYRILGNVPSTVPEPSTAILLAMGLAVASLGFRRARAPQP